MTINEIISQIIIKKRLVGGIKSVVFVGCGGSLSALYPAKYFLDCNSKSLRTACYTSNEFVHLNPAYIGPNSIVISMSHRGNTPETIAATKKARESGADSIVLTFIEQSPLANQGDYVITYDWGFNADQENSNVSKALKIALEIINQTEGYQLYDNFLLAFKNIDSIISDAKAATIDAALEFASNYRNEPIIYVMGSGTGFSAAYSFSICILMEMQWMNSSYIHSGEYFHGPFEITEENVPFILLIGSGRTRPMDLRAFDFLKKFGKKYLVLDSQTLGLRKIDKDIAEYFDHLFFTVLLRQYAEALAEARNHPLSERRYMWKIEY